MGSFFSMDGMFYKFGSMLADIMILSFLWIFFSIPIFTVGASTTALFYVTTKRVSNKEGYIFRDYWKSFKSNFLMSTLVWILMLLAVFIIVTDVRIAQNAEIIGNIRIIILPLLLGISIELLLVSSYIFPIISRFEMKLKDTIKTAFFMANKHLLTSILLLALGLVIITMVYVYPLFFLICSGTYAYAASYFIVKIFKKYRPDIDSDDDIYREISPHLLLDDDDTEGVINMEQNAEIFNDTNTQSNGNNYVNGN